MEVRQIAGTHSLPLCLPEVVLDYGQRVAVVPELLVAAAIDGFFFLDAGAGQSGAAAAQKYF